MEVWHFILILIGVFLFFGLLGGPTPLPEQEDKKPDQQKTYSLPDQSNPIEFLDFLKNADQECINQLYESGKEYEISDSILRRAFVKRWRHETLDFQFWKDEIKKREYNRANGIKRKVRTKQELYEDFFTYNLKGYHVDEIEGYKIVNVFDITGIHIRDRYDYIEQNLKEDDDLWLEKEDHNEFDSKAVKILHKKRVLGYVPRTDTMIVRRAMKYGYICKLYSFGNDNDWKFATFALYVKNLS